MPMTVNDVVTRATLLLNDVGNTTIGVASNTRWTQDELVDWVSDAQRQIVLARPSASNEVVKVSLVAGTRQSIPADGWLLLSVNRNLTSTGLAGRAIRQVNRAILDAQDPNWHTAAKTVAVWNYMYDVNDQYSFSVYPPNTGTGFLELNYSVMPPQLVQLTDTLLLDSIYLTPMVDYVCFRALSKDAEFAGGATLAGNFFNAFNAAIGQRGQAEKTDSPDSAYSQPGPGNFGPAGVVQR